MTPEDAIVRLEAEFGKLDSEHAPNDTREITSAGERPAETDPDEPPPGLFATRELAVRAWYREVADFLREQTPTAWRIVDGVNVDKWRITVADAMNTHRIGADRYSVSAKIGLVWLTADPQPAPAS